MVRLSFSPQAIAVSLILVCSALAATAVRGEIAVGTSDFVFDADEGRKVQVWIYRPKAYSADDPIVFVMHGMLRNGETYRKPWIALADESPCLVVVPEFSEESFPSSRMYQFGNLRDQQGKWHDEPKWSFTAIEQIFDQVREEAGSNQQGYYLFGHSAGSQFAHRMLLFASQTRAELVIAANAGSYTLPTAEVEYPFGIGGTPIDDEALAERLSRRLVVLLGEQDNDPNNRSLPRTAGAQAQGPHRVARGERFFRTAEQQAQRLGQPLAWTLQMVPGVAHDNSKMAPAAARAIFAHAAAARAQAGCPAPAELSPN